MLTGLMIDGVATFTSPTMMGDLKTINFVFGSNGTGKTTISRVLADPHQHASCSVVWAHRAPLPCLVYNRDFRERNFSQPGPLPGVFSLGEDNVQLNKDIADKNKEIEAKRETVARLKRALDGDATCTGKRQEIDSAKERFAQTCWNQMRKHEADFRQAFSGSMGSKADFRERLLAEATTNQAHLLKLDQLEERATTVFGVTPNQEATLRSLTFAELEQCERSELLSKTIVGRGDVEIAALVSALGNGDWVRAGRPFFDKSCPKCPFCQQTAPANLRQQLDMFFDPTYETDCNAVAGLLATYQRQADLLGVAVQELIDVGSPRVDDVQLRLSKQAIDAALADNIRRLQDKQREPSKRVALTSIAEACKPVNDLVAAANAEISRHNNLVRNLATERRTLIAQVWRYLLDVELKDDLSAYRVEARNLNAGVEALEAKVNAAEADISQLQGELARLEGQTTTVKPTMNGINKLLKGYGFETFALEESSHTKGSYELVRPDGRHVHDTLSDGERTFLTLLYFYHLVRGSATPAGATTPRVVVFDDPISSLDSDVLFVVSSLIKDVFTMARDSSNPVQQVFVMTHNVFFHKEVTFNSKRQADKRLSDETFWVVRRHGSVSSVAAHESNPVKSSYDLLWEEVRAPSPRPNTICNAMRRILENYFKILGGQDLHTLYETFDGEEKIMCRSLVSWINDGSHFAMDDLHVTQSDETVQKYLAVFRKIFERHDHGAHYRMMMGDAYVESTGSV